MCIKSPHNGPKLLQNHHNITPHIILETSTTSHQNSFISTLLNSNSYLTSSTHPHISPSRPYLTINLFHTSHHSAISYKICPLMQQQHKYATCFNHQKYAREYHLIYNLFLQVKILPEFTPILHFL